jgi:hypothetical protein
MYQAGARYYKSRFKADSIHSMEGGSNSTNIYSKSRSDIKIGKLVNKLFPGKYSASELKSLLIHLKAGTENSAENWEWFLVVILEMVFL